MESAAYRADVPQVPQKGNSLRQSDVLVREVENVAMKVVRSGGSALMKLALVDSVDHTLKKLPSLFAAVVVDDTRV